MCNIMIMNHCFLCFLLYFLYMNIYVCILFFWTVNDDDDDVTIYARHKIYLICILKKMHNIYITITQR